MSDAITNPTNIENVFKREKPLTRSDIPAENQANELLAEKIKVQEEKRALEEEKRELPKRIARLEAERSQKSQKGLTGTGPFTILSRQIAELHMRQTEVDANLMGAQIQLDQIK